MYNRSLLLELLLEIEEAIRRIEPGLMPPQTLLATTRGLIAWMALV